MCICVPHHSFPLRKTRLRVRIEIKNSSMPTNQVLGVDKQSCLVLKFKLFQARNLNNVCFQTIDEIYQSLIENAKKIVNTNKIDCLPELKDQL